MSADEIAGELILRIERSETKPKRLRISHAGDFNAQSDLDKMSKIADRLKPYGVVVFGYTAAKKLKVKYR